MWEKPELLLLLITANGTPILLDKALGPRLNRPLDGGLVLKDGSRLLGDSATIRGAAGAVLVTAGLASLLGHGARVGALVGALSMVGDALSSFVKRRMGLQPGDKSTGLDQIPESLLPLLAVAHRYGLGWADIALLVTGFTVFDMAASRLLYRLKIRRRPH
jgi:CDP-2,3-bis-(O-geranylgeranyl)-sn-glycerol synthase